MVVEMIVVNFIIDVVERRIEEEQGTERHRNYCFLEGNKDSCDPRIGHVDKWTDITQGAAGESCELQSRRQQGHMPVIHDEEELNRLAEPELGGRCTKELLAGEGLLEANRLQPEHNDDEMLVIYCFTMTDEFFL